MKLAVDSARPVEISSSGEGEGSPGVSRALYQKLFLQRLLGWILLLPLYGLVSALIHFRFGFTIEGHRALRKKFRAIAQQPGPLLLCANHLTLVDSILVLWALGSPMDFLRHYRLLAWNVPAIENYRSKPTWRILTYVGKCIPIDRSGSRQHLDTILELLAYLLRRHELCMLFPEGTRSRTGKICPEAVTYGVGKLLRKVPECTVLCVYLRGLGQQTFSDFPAKGESFHVEMEALRPRSEQQGLRAVRDLSVQVIEKLKEMEDRFFERRDRHFPG